VLSVVRGWGHGDTPVPRRRFDKLEPCLELPLVSSP
jgi:hypothetical protein